MSSLTQLFDARRRVLLLLCLAFGCVALALAVLPGRAAAADGPWGCGAFGYLFQNSGTAGPTTVYRVDLATGKYTSLGTAALQLNAMGFNTLDGYMYGFDSASGVLYRLGSDLTETSLGTPAGSVAGVVGDFDNAGHLWVLGANASGNVMEEIDLAPGSSTYGQVIKSGPSANPAGLSGGADWSWINGYLYRTMQTDTGTLHLVRVDPANGNEVDLGSLGVTVTGGGVGATYADPNYLYASDHASGYIYRINPTNLQTIKVADGPPSLNNDGARCDSAQIPTITVTKSVAGRIAASDQFTVGLDDSSGTTLTSASTSGTGTSAATTNWPVTQGSTYTITDAMASGSADPLSEYASKISCTNTTTGQPVTPGGSAPDWTLPVTDAAAYTCDVTNGASADLSLTKTASSSPVTPGTNETYTLTAKNNGPSPASNAVVSDPLPSGLTYVSSTGGCSVASGTVTCPAGTMAPGAAKTFTVVAKVDPSDTSTITNNAKISSPTPDPNPGNNTPTDPVPVSPKADLSVVKSASPSTAVAGKDETYKLVVKNDGPSDARDASVTDPLPNGLSFVSASSGCSFKSGTVTCAAGTMAPGATKTFKVVAKVSPSDTAALTNTATVHSPTPDPNPHNNTSTITTPVGPEADLAITKTASTGSVPVGGQVMYTLVVHDNGPSDATGVTVKDPLPAGLSLVSIKPSQGSCSGTTCHLGTIADGGSAQILVTAKVGAAAKGNVVNKATVTGNNPDPTPGNNTDTSTIIVPGPKQTTSDLQIVKTANHARVFVGQSVTYTLTVTNHGPDAAKDVKITDTPSRALKVLSAKTSRGSCKVSGKVLRCSLGTIGNGRQVKITVNTRMLKVGTEVNAASATSSSKDPKPSNNLSKVEAKVAQKAKAKAVLHLRKIASSRTVTAGHTITYHIRVSASKAAAHQVKVCDALPLGLSFTGATPKAKLTQGKECWAVTTLGKGKSRTFTVHVRALTGSSGRKTNHATATAKGVAVARAKATMRVDPAPKKVTPVTG